MVDAYTGAMGSVLAKLSALLREDHGRIHRRQRQFLRRLHDELYFTQFAAMQMCREMDDEQPPAGQWARRAAAEHWATRAAEITYDLEDQIDDSLLAAVALASSSRELTLTLFGRLVTTLTPPMGRWMKRLDAIPMRGALALDTTSPLWGDFFHSFREASEKYGFHKQKPTTATVAAATVPRRIDPRLALYTNTDPRHIVGLEEQKSTIVSLLEQGLNDDHHPLKVVSIVGLGGLGKTTLARAVYADIQGRFQCTAFVSVSKDPDLKSVLRDILFDCRGDRYYDERFMRCDEEQLIRELRQLLTDKRYLIVIDDIWSTQVWHTVKSSLPENHHGSRIITTTRIIYVADESCCNNGTKGHVYSMVPLSYPDSRKLFFSRIFGSEDQCPASLEKVSKNILKRCRGLPLAIIAISGLLMSKPRTCEEWMKVDVSMNPGDGEISNMNRILSLSFHDLPSHLRTCMLYLSIFPEDYVIGREQLVWKWIAEGFISTTHGSSLEQIGNSYFNELINRSMIQAVDIQYDGTAQACRVHDMVLELIISLSTKLNFVTIQDHKLRELTHDRIRRLSHRSSNAENAIKKRSSDTLVHLRSFNLFGSVKNVPHIGDSKALRVLDLGSCRSIDDNHMKIIACLFQLRYLGLYRTRVTELPEEIGNLKNLQTLDLRGCGVRKVPETFAQLRSLQRLLVQNGVTLPDDIGNMRALELLLSVSMPDHSIRFVEQLSKLIEMKTLEMIFGKPVDMGNEVRAYTDCLVSSLSKLVNLETLTIHAEEGSPLDSMMDICPTFQRLQKIIIGHISGLPRWIASLRNLLHLEVQVDTIKKEDLHLLGGIPTLMYLELNSKHTPKEMLIVTNKSFRCLQELHLLYWNDGVGLVFENGAMPRLRTLHICLVAREAIISKNAGVYSSIGLLSGLENLHAEVNCCDCTNEDVEAMEASIVRVADEHSNQLTLEMQRKFQERMVTDDDRKEYLNKPMKIRRNRRFTRVQIAFRWREAQKRWSRTVRKKTLFPASY